MESLIKKENELHKLAENGEYLDILELADFLYDQKRYKEAKEEYLKIAGPEDLSGDANSHLFQMLLDMGKYEEALTYYGYVKNCCDTSPAEGAYFRLTQELRNPESELFMFLDEETFYYDCLGLIYDDYVCLDKCLEQDDDDFEDKDCGEVETGELYLQKNIETILLTRAKSDDEAIQKSAKTDLLWLYLNGSFRVGDFAKYNLDAKNIDKAVEASIVFAEHPDIIHEIYADWSYFQTAIEDIYEYCDGDFDEAEKYVKRLVIAILRRAEELGNIEVVFDKIERELYKIYADSDYSIPFYLGYISEGLSRVPSFAFASFKDCGNEELESIVIPEGITSIDEGAFTGCKNLKSVTIPASVTEIGEYVFFNCPALTSITVNENNQFFKSIDGNLYYKYNDEEILVQYAVGKTNKTFTVPDGITEISDEAFRLCKSLKNIVIPDSVTYIGEDVFSGCENLTIKGSAGSEAENYANVCGMSFEEI